VYHSFEELEVWKRSCQLAVEIYRKLRECRDYELRDQMQRAAVSIASNIAEGAERPTKDFARFLGIAQGSAAELRTQVYIAARVDILDIPTMQRFVDELKQISRMLRGLQKSLNTQSRSPSHGD